MGARRPRSHRWYERVVRPALFRLGGGDAEAAHEWTLHRLATLCRSPAGLRAVARMLDGPAARPIDLFGLRFANPVGLAAGVDKNGVALPAWPVLGFGFVETGTVTHHPQPGNARPRVFRLRHSAAVINRMGFNNDGAAALARRLSVAPPLPVPLGISLGKSRVTPVADATADYLASMRLLRPYGDYFAVNVSSPNTPGLRSLQDAAQLSELLGALRTEAGPDLPILVKIAPDLTEPAIAEAVRVCLDHGIAGMIATNTTLRRGGLDPRDVLMGEQTGGLSGSPLAARSREVVAFIHRETGGALPVVGVGGILQTDDALRLLDAGASLVQLYTGLIYRGPTLVRDIVSADARRSAKI